MSVTTDMTVTPIFDELAERLGLVWDLDTTDLDTTDLDTTDLDTDTDTTDGPATAESAEAETEADDVH